MTRSRTIAVASVLSIAAAYALASWDFCDWPGAKQPTVVFSARADGGLQAGAAVVELAPPYPVVAAGYGPPRPDVTTTNHPLRARAVVLKQGALSVGVVSIDVLLIPEEVARDIRARSGLDETWVIATHTHSSFGGYDDRSLAELAGTGLFREAAKKAVVDGALDALAKAAAQVFPVEVEVARGEGDLCVARSGSASDERLVRVRFVHEGVRVAQWLMLAAHPALVPRKPAALDPDYPGAMAGETATLVLQTAVGNATAKGDGIEAVAQRAMAQLEGLDGQMLGDVGLDVARVRFSTPSPDASRLVPASFARSGRNFLCASAAREAEVGVLRLGSLTLVAVPAEVTFGAAQALEHDGVRVLSVANGYLGYLEPGDVVDNREGEARRQYYDRALLDEVKRATELGLETVGVSQK